MNSHEIAVFDGSKVPCLMIHSPQEAHLYGALMLYTSNAIYKQLNKAKKMASSWTGVERSIAQWRGIKGYRKISKISKVQKCPVHGQIQLVVLRWLIDVLSKQSLRCFATSPVQALRDEDRDQACQTVQIACPTVYYNDLLTNILAIFINSINHNILTIFFVNSLFEDVHGFSMFFTA